MKLLLKIFGIILLIGFAIGLWPFALGGSVAWYLWKKKKIRNPKVRYSVIAASLIFAFVAGIGWITVTNASSASQSASPSPSPEVAVAKPSVTTPPYKVLQITSDKDTNNQVYSMQIYALETPMFPYDEAKIKDLLDTIQGKECKSGLDTCYTSLYDDEHFAQESYAFDIADATPGQTAMDNFEKQYPDFDKLDEHHLVADSWTGKIHYYPLLTVAKETITPAQTVSGAIQSTSLSGTASLYPNHALTPGEVFTNVTTAQVCTSGYSSSVRNVPTSEKEQVFAEYGIPYASHANYEVDHFISLELGGDNSIQNLWPEPGASPNQKDKVENYLHAEMCSGKITLAEAQKEISSDWYKIYQSMNGSSTATATTNTYIPPVVNTSSNTSGSTTTSTSITTQAGQATGRCNDGSETYAVNHQGACSHHQGVAQWY